MNMRAFIGVCGLAVALLAGWPAAAQSADKKEVTPRDPKVFDFSYGPPQSPVLPLIGVESNQITRVDSFQKFGVSVINSVEGTGSSPALAVDVSPFWLTDSAVTLEQYKDIGYFDRVMARSKVSAAFSEGDKDKNVPSTVVVSLATKLL